MQKQCVQFNVLFQYHPRRGNTLGYSDIETRNNLANVLQVELKVLETLFDGRSWMIKRNVSRDVAEKIGRAFERAGAPCFIQPVDDSATPERTEEATAEKLIFQYAPHEFSPMFYAKPRPASVSNDNEKKLFFIQAQSPVVGLLVPFAISVFVAIMVQEHATTWLSEQLTGSVSTTALSIASFTGFILVIYLLFSLLTARSGIAFYQKTADNPFLLLHKRHWYFAPVWTYQLYNANGAEIGRIRFNPFGKRCTLMDMNGMHRAAMSINTSAEDAVVEAAFTLRETLFSSWLFSLVQHWFSGKLERSSDTIFTVRNAQGLKIGTYRLSKKQGKLSFDTSINGSVSPGLQHQIFAMSILLSL
jgi:hypothetical protein